MDKQSNNLIQYAAKLIRDSKFTVAFTGAGISVESGIPPFRGEHGLWNKYDPLVLDLNYYEMNQDACWVAIREIFYDFFAEARPNSAHKVLAKMEENGLLQSLVTQNIDNLHYEAGNRVVHEFHGNAKKLICPRCKKNYNSSDIDFSSIPPVCNNDGAILKPDFIFFGEGIPPGAYTASFEDAEKAEVCIVIGSTGEVVPASYVPQRAKQNGAVIIEINPEPSNFTRGITDVFLQGKAGEMLLKLDEALF